MKISSANKEDKDNNVPITADKIALSLIIDIKKTVVLIKRDGNPQISNSTNR